MAQPKHLDGPRFNLRINSRATFADDLAFFGRTVGPRRGRDARTHAQMEDYCLRRWIIATVAADRLPLPLTIEAPAPGVGYPDYMLRLSHGEEELGLEVTEAGDATWQAWLTKTESSNGPRLWMDNEDGYAGDAPERIVVRDIVDAIRRKATARREGKYSAVARCDLLIYENSEGGLLSERAEVIRRLTHDAREELKTDMAEFRQIHLLFADNVYLDLFGNERLPPIDVSHEYADGWSDWLESQARYLRERNFNALDVDNLAGELDSLARADQRAFKSQLRRLLVHLLKWKYQQSRRAKSWSGSITSARDQMEELLEENPSFENRIDSLVKSEYPRAVREASRETRIVADNFPADCPFTIDQLRDPNFLPE